MARAKADATETGYRSKRRAPKVPFKPGQNSHTDEVHRRGPDLVPRVHVRRALLLKALTGAQLRDRKTGAPVRGGGSRGQLVHAGA